MDYAVDAVCPLAVAPSRRLLELLNYTLNAGALILLNLGGL